MDKEKVLCLILWGVLAYAVALLLYFTLKLLGHSADFLSACGSILSASATFFAAIVAIKLYSDWRDPASYSLKKEQIFKVLSITAKLRFQLSNISEALIAFKKSKEFIVLNDQYLIYEVHDLKKQIFETVPSAKYLSPNIFSNYTEIERHFTYVEIFYIQAQKEYIKYYDQLIKNNFLKDKDIHINPYKSYSYYQIEKQTYPDSLLKSTSRTVGYQVLDNGKLISGFSYENLSSMVAQTITLIDNIETTLINELKNK